MKRSPLENPAAGDFEDLGALLDGVWRALELGADRGRSAFHTPAIATVDESGAPDIRHVVLRHANREERVLAFHTDARAPKIEHLRRVPLLNWCFYDPTAGVQIRAAGRATVHHDDEESRAAWEESRLASRRCYLAPHAPGTELPLPEGNLPPHLLDREPTPEESEAGFVNFCVVRSTIDRLDWLNLNSAGHRRAQFCWREEKWLKLWLAP